MEVEYTTTAYTGNGERQETESVSDFLYNTLLFEEETYHRSGGKIRLENQPKVVCDALGRLVERLLDKNVLNLDDLKYISDIGYGKKADTLQLKKKESS